MTYCFLAGYKDNKKSRKWIWQSDVTVKAGMKLATEIMLTGKYILKISKLPYLQLNPLAVQGCRNSVKN
jgi:hypothetical protein